ncbi:hypothetical protein ACIRL2_41465 [Embleya sp. NPDC127516]
MNDAAPESPQHRHHWRGFARDVAVNVVGSLLVVAVVALIATLLG